NEGEVRRAHRVGVRLESESGILREHGAQPFAVHEVAHMKRQRRRDAPVSCAWRFAYHQPPPNQFGLFVSENEPFQLACGHQFRGGFHGCTLLPHGVASDTAQTNMRWLVPETLINRLHNRPASPQPGRAPSEQAANVAALEGTFTLASKRSTS